MDNSEQSFFGTRLRLARKMAGMSLQELSGRLEGKVTKQALNKYELNQMKPTSEVLLYLARVLEVKPDYFLKQAPLKLGTVSFRKRVSLSKKNEASIVEKARDYAERFAEVETLLNIQSKFDNPLAHFIISSNEDAEKAADLLRAEWELGKNPIPNLIEMLELKGVKVFIIDATTQFDGLAVTTESSTPLVVINKREKPLERLRFTIIHELSHILLRLDESVRSDEKLVEELCHRFASCFLIPTTKIKEFMGGDNRSYIKIEELISVKEYFGISIRAIVHRLKVLGIITPSYYQRWSIFLSKKYGGKSEPGNYSGKEASMVMGSYVNRGLAQEVISFSKAAYLLNTSISELRKGNIEAG